MGWDWLYLKDSLRYTLVSLILVTFVQTIFDSIRFLTVFYLANFLGFILFCKCARYIVVSLFLQTLSISIRLCYCSQVLYGFVCFSTSSFRVVST